MALPPLTTILNNAPLIIQGANQLLKMLRDKSQADASADKENAVNDQEDATADLQQDLKTIHQRLDSRDQSAIQQTELIQALAKQNETLASSVQSATRYSKLVLLIATVALIIALVCLLLLFRQS